MSALSRLFSAEVPPLPERWRPLLDLYMAGFAVIYAVTFLATLHFVFLGPGLGDEMTLHHLLAILETTFALGSEQGAWAWLLAFLALLGFSTAFRGWIFWRGYAGYRRAMGEAIPLNEVVALTATNLLNIAFAPLALAALAGLAWLAGLDPALGWEALARLAAWANAQAMAVPTLVELPRWGALLATIMVWTFAHYWLHRWSHTRRALWLLFHRPHHMTPHLCYGTALPVFMSFPVFLLVVVPYVFLFTALGRLFSPTPLYAEIILFHLVIYIGEIYGHSPALYEKAIRNPLVRGLGFVYCQGVYHVLHHSAAVDTQRKTSNNTVNIGTGLFSCWDILFGTFQPLTRKCPPIGLHGQPRLVLNPLRLLTAGAVQLVYELAHNPVRDWWRILTGPADWAPATSRDFLVHPRPAAAPPPIPESPAC